MSLRVTDVAMTSSVTGHTAKRGPGGTWLVSWLPAPRVPLDRNAALTALTLAELVAAGVCNPKHPQWPELENLARELDLTADSAVYLIKEST